MEISRRQFDRILEAEIEALPPQFAQWLDEVAIIVEDEPTEKLLLELGMNPDEEDLDGLFSGHALTEKSVEHSGVLPPQIMIFRLPLAESCDNLDQLKEEIRITLLHELGHYAGLNEDDLKNLGYD